MNWRLSALPLTLLCLSSSQAQSPPTSKNANAVQTGDIIIGGDSDEDGQSLGIEAFGIDALSGIDVEPLYGSTVLSGNKLSAEKIYAALFIVPPKGAAIGGNGSALGYSRPWIFLGMRTTTENLRPPHKKGSTKDHPLDYEFDGRNKTVTIGHQKFDLAKGKYFVVALDNKWQPVSTQLKDDLKVAPLPAKTLAALRHLFLKSNGMPKP